MNISVVSRLYKSPKQVICTAPVAQLDRVSGYEPEGRAFESLRVRHKNIPRPSSSG